MTTGGYGPNLTVPETQLTRCQEAPLYFDQGTTLERRERLAPLGSSEECPRQDRAQRLEVVCPPGSGLHGTSCTNPVSGGLPGLKILSIEGRISWSMNFVADYPTPLMITQQGCSIIVVCYLSRGTHRSNS